MRGNVACSGDDCVPGCTMTGWEETAWCSEEEHPWPCAWPPEALVGMMKEREVLRERNVKPANKKWDDDKFYNEARHPRPLRCAPLCSVTSHARHSSLPHTRLCLTSQDDECSSFMWMPAADS